MLFATNTFAYNPSLNTKLVPINRISIKTQNLKL